jgi:UDP-N-acetylglucosamine acyltransferase
MDIPPYMLAVGERAKLFGPNTVGLKRKNFSRESIMAIKRAYRIVFRSNIPLKEAIAQVRQDVPPLPEVENFLNFISEPSNRGLTR